MCVCFSVRTTERQLVGLPPSCRSPHRADKVDGIERPECRRTKSEAGSCTSLSMSKNFFFLGAQPNCKRAMHHGHISSTPTLLCWMCTQLEGPRRLRLRLNHQVTCHARVPLSGPLRRIATSAVHKAARWLPNEPP